MKQTTRTIAFAAVAAGSLALAAVTNQLTQPSQVEGFEKVGKEFYSEFIDPTQAASLRVASYDDDTASTKLFSVEHKDGAWKIPSHHYYPADAEDQLAKTATSVIGIKRGALVSRRATDHERFGVMDPLDEVAATLKGRGKRLTLLDKSGNTLVDLIIGKKDEDGSNEYYVRRKDEKETYLANIEISLSTKFSDWVEQDLLKLERNRLTSVKISRPNIDPQGRITGEDVLTVSRPSASDSWHVEGMNDEQERVKTAEVNKLVSALDDLKLAGVRPKPRGADGKPLLTADLKFRVPPEFARSPQLQQEVLRSLQSDLARRGFIISADENNKTRIYSEEGDLVAATDEGIQYTLHFGRSFAGDEEEIEIGGSEDADEDAEADDAEAKEGDTAEQDAADKSEEDAGVKKSRYMYVRADFDESLVTGKPTAPTAPTKPEILKEDDAAEKPASEEGDSAEEQAEKSEQDQKADDQSSDADAAKDDAGETAKDEAADPKAAAQAAYDAEMKEFESKLSQYEHDLKSYEKKVEEGRKKAEELNERFSDWYYVIADESYQKLRPTYGDLVEPKEEEATEDDGASSASPGTALPDSVTAPVQPAASEKSPEMPETSSEQKTTADDAVDSSQPQDPQSPEPASSQPQPASSPEKEAAAVTDTPKQETAPPQSPETPETSPSAPTRDETPSEPADPQS